MPVNKARRSIVSCPRGKAMTASRLNGHYIRPVLFVALMTSSIATAYAQGASNTTEEVVVTGTSIRGVQPVGADLISVGRVEIDKTAAQTVQDILKQVPALSNLGQAAQGNTTPAIHNLGAVSSYSTLVLIDGHRFSLGGQTQTLPDPGI